MKQTVLCLAILVILAGSVNAFDTQSIHNDYLDVRVATFNVYSIYSYEKVAEGRFTAGTAAGQRILYGYPEDISTSYTTIKIEAPVNAEFIYGSDSGIFAAPPVTFTVFDAFNNSMNVRVWNLAAEKISVTQSLKLVANPRTYAKKDTLAIKYTITNSNTFDVKAGVRLLLDTQLGMNDNSPITAAGYGRVTHETKWTGAAVPESWQTVDNIDNPRVKAEAYVKGPGATPPDMMIIGQWDNMKEGVNHWDYAVAPNFITDTVVAVFWMPVTLTAGGGEASFVTYYGLPDFSGAELGITKTVSPALAAYDDVLSYHFNYSNTGDMNLTNLFIWDDMPGGTSFLNASPGYDTWTASGIVSWSFPADTIIPGTPYEAWFRVSLTAHTGLSVENWGVAEYTDSYWNDKEVKISNKVITGILTATITQTHTITPTHSITPTFTITPTSTNTPVPLVMEFTGVFPNPSGGDVNFIVKLSRDADVKVSVLTVSGETVARITKACEKGQNAVLWDAKNAGKSRAASGVYLYIVEAVTERNEKMTANGKFALIK